MAKTVISIEIGESKTRVVELIMGKQRQHVKNALIFDTPQNALEDGFIRDYGLFAEQLMFQLREANIKAKNIVFAISSNKVISREITITASKEKLIKNIVLAEVGEYFPMDLSEHIIAYSIIGHDVENDQYRLMIYAAPEALIYGYYSVAHEMHCNVESIDFVGNAVYQWFKRSTLQDVSLVMEVNEKSSVITILDKGEMGVQRTINHGVSALADALAESGSYDGINTTEAAMELLLNQRFLAVGKEGEEQWRKAELAKIRGGRFQRIETGKAETENGEVTEAERSVERLLSDEEIIKRREVAREDVTEAANMLISNIQRVIDYYISKNNGANVESIYITGLGASVEGLDELVAAETEIPTEIYDATEGVTFAGVAEAYENKGQDFVACFGAVLNPLGFRPADIELKERKKNITMLSATVFLSAAVVMGVMMIVTSVEINKQEERKEALSAEIAEAVYIEDLQTVYEASQVSVQMMAETDALTFVEGEQLNDIITELELALPKRSTVHNMSISGPSMVISFSTVTKEEAAKVLMQLKAIPYIRSVSIGGITETLDRATNSTEVSFTVNCELQKYERVSDVTVEGEEE